jgi:glycosyltransferase involved in cell wall biosynthesis
MKISFLLTELGSTGGSINFYKFMDKLSERGYETYLITPTTAITWEPGFSEKIIQKVNNPSISIKQRALSHIYNLGKIALSKTPGVKNKVLSLLNRDPIGNLQRLTGGFLSNWVPSEVTIAHSCFGAYAAYALMDKTIPLYYIQQYEELYNPNEFGQKLARLACFMPIELIAGGSWVREQIRKRMGRDSYLLNPGIDHSIFFPRHDTGEKYSNYRPVRVVSYARNIPSNGWSESVEAMRMVFSELGEKAVEWNVFWSQPRPRPPQDIKVNFVNNRYRDLAPLYSDSHICFFSYWYTGFPGALLEPMACGTAVVTSGLGTEEIAIDGQNSLVVPPRDPKRLADAIIRLARDSQLARNLAEKGIETAQQFTWEKAADNIEQIINKTVKDYPFSGAFSDIPNLVSGKFL